MKKIAFILIASGFIVACQSEHKTTQTTDTASVAQDVRRDTLTFDYDSVKVYSKDIAVSADRKGIDTTKATITYPVFIDKNVNNFVQSNALASKSPDEPSYKSYKELANGFIKNFEDFKKKNADYGQVWFKEINIQVLPQRKNYLGLKYIYEDYAGGAHGSHNLIYENYNPITHQVITLDALIKPGSMSQLTAIAEKIFRKNEKLTADQSLKDNYFFDKDVFSLNRNFTITDKGLKFLYNPYEIKAYVFGTTELFIPFETIKDILKPSATLPAL